MWNIKSFRVAVRAKQIEWRKHVLQRMSERGISQATVVKFFLDGEKIRDFGDDKPFASALFLGYDAAKPLHIVAAFDEVTKQVFVINVYEPSLNVFESDYKTRKKL